METVAIKKATIKKIILDGKEQEFDVPLINPQYYSYIIVVGTQSHSSDLRRNLLAPLDDIPGIKSKAGVAEGSKLMFVHQALRRMRLNKDIRFEFLLCERGYSSRQRQAIKAAVEQKYKGKYIEVQSAKEIIDYINKGKGYDRNFHPIKQLLFYSHGVVGEISLGLAPAGIDITEYSFEEKQASQLKKEAFDVDAHIYLFSCRGGIGNPKIDRTIYIDPAGSKTAPPKQIQYSVLRKHSPKNCQCGGSNRLCLFAQNGLWRNSFYQR